MKPVTQIDLTSLAIKANAELAIDEHCATPPTPGWTYRGVPQDRHQATLRLDTRRANLVGSHLFALTNMNRSTALSTSEELHFG